MSQSPIPEPSCPVSDRRAEPGQEEVGWRDLRSTSRSRSHGAIVAYRHVDSSSVLPFSLICFASCSTIMLLVRNTLTSATTLLGMAVGTKGTKDQIAGDRSFIAPSSAVICRDGHLRDFRIDSSSITSLIGRQKASLDPLLALNPPVNAPTWQNFLMQTSRMLRRQVVSATSMKQAAARC
jgi:hypothetical protein